MRTDLFDFELPEQRIALHPVSPRDAARLLVVGPQTRFEDRIVRELPELLRSGDALVFNDTRVIPVALEGVRRRGELQDPDLLGCPHQQRATRRDRPRRAHRLSQSAAGTPRWRQPVNDDLQETIRMHSL